MKDRISLLRQTVDGAFAFEPASDVGGALDEPARQDARKQLCPFACRPLRAVRTHDLRPCLDTVATTLFQAAAGYSSADHIQARLNNGRVLYEHWLVAHADEVREEQDRREKINIEALEAQRRWDAWEQKSAEEERRRRRQVEELAKRGPEIDENAGISLFAHNSSTRDDADDAQSGQREFAGPLLYSTEDGTPALYDIALDAEPRGSVLVKFSVAALLEKANAARLQNGIFTLRTFAKISSFT